MNKENERVKLLAIAKLQERKGLLETAAELHHEHDVPLLHAVFAARAAEAHLREFGA